MTDTTLAQRLRDYAENLDEGPTAWPGGYKEAADALDAKDAEIARLTAANKALTGDAENAIAMLETQAKLHRAAEAKLATALEDALRVGEQMLDQKFRADRLSAELAEAREERDALAAFAFWFRRWPEYKPSTELSAEVQADFERAKPFIPARAFLSSKEVSQ